MCGNIDFSDIDILGGLEHEVYYATRNYDTIDLNPFDEGEALELDFNATAEDIAAAIVEDPFGTVGTAALLVTGFGGPLALALNQGASTAYRGGSAEDIITSMALTYAGGKVGEVVSNQASTALTQNFGEAVASSPLSTAIIGGTEQFSTTLIHSFNPADGSFNFEAASNAFLTGNLASGIGYTLGAIDDTLINTIGEDGAWTNLGAGIRDSATAGIVAAVQGGNITEDALRNLVSGYTNNIEILSDLQKSLGDTFGDDMVRVIGEGLNSSLNAAIEGGLEPTDAFFANLKTQADTQIRDFIDSSEGLALNDKLDTLFGNKGRATEAFETLQAARTNATNAANGYTAIYNEEDRLYQLYTEAVDTYNANKNQTNLDAVNAAGTAFTTYSNDNADAKAEFLSTYNEIAPTLPGLTSAYDTALKSMLTDIDDLGDEFPSVEEVHNETVATALALTNAITDQAGPKFDKAVYAAIHGLDSEDEVYEHYFRNQGLALDTDLKRALRDTHSNVLEQTLNANGVDYRFLNPEQIAAAIEYLEEEVPNFASLTGPDDLIRIGDNILREIETRASAINPDINNAIIDPDNYIFDEGVTLSDIAAGNAVTMPVRDQDGKFKLRWTDKTIADNTATSTQQTINRLMREEGQPAFAVINMNRDSLTDTYSRIADLIKLGYDITAVDDLGAGLREALMDNVKQRVSEVEGTSDAGGYDRLLGNQESNFGVTLTDMTVEEVLEFQKARGPGTYAAYSQDVNEDRGFLRDDGTGVISTPAGKYQVVGRTLQGLVDAGVVNLDDTYNEETQEKIGSYLIEQRGLFDSNISAEQFVENLGNEFEGIARFGYESADSGTSIAMREDVISSLGLNVPVIETENITYTFADLQRIRAEKDAHTPLIMSMNKEDGAAFDAQVGGNVYQNLTKLANMFGYVPAAGGEERFKEFEEMFSNVASVVTGAFGEVANVVSVALDYGGAEGASEFTKEMSQDLLSFSNSAKSDQWLAQGEENAQRYNNLIAEWEADNPGQELTNAQKGLLKTEAIFTNIQDAPVQWVAENIGGEIIQEFFTLGFGAAAKFGTSVFLRGAKKADITDMGDNLISTIENTAGVGGAVAADIGEAYFATVDGAYDQAYAVAINQGFTEEDADAYASELAIKNGTVAAVLTTVASGLGGAALAKSIFNPKNSEITNRAIDGLEVTFKEGVTEGFEEGFTSAHLASSLVQIDPNYDVAGDIVEAGILGTLIGGGTAGGIYTGDFLIDSLIQGNEDVRNALNSADPTVARDALVNLGLTDVDRLNTMLNTSYDEFIVTTDEVGQIIAEANPDFTADADTIASYVGERSEADTKAEIEQFVGDNYVTEEEVDTAATAAGITLTDEEKAQYVGQSANETSLTTFAEDVEAAKGEIVSFFEENNYDPTDAQVNNFLDGLTLTDARKEAISSYIDPRQITEAEARQFFSDLGYEPSEEEIESYVGQNTDDTVRGPRRTRKPFESYVRDNIATYVDPRQTTEAEVRAAFEAAGFTPTDEQVQQFVGQLDQTRQETAVGEFIDPLQTTRDEVVAAFDAAGFTATDEEIDSFVGQLNQADQELKISDYIDPLQTTKTEVEAAFAAAGYTPTEAEIERFVGQLEQTAQETAIGDYVDPRLATDAEIRAAFAAAGFTPTDEEVALFTGQFDQETQEAGVADYVDPRQVTTAEIRAAYEALGLVDVLQEDVDRFTGQRDEAAALEELRQYAPTATLNIVNQVIGSPAVEDDPNTTDIDESKEATGLYASVENSLAEAVGGLENISLEDVKDTVNNIVSNLATNTDVTNALATAISSLPEVPTTTDLQNAVTEAFAGLNDLSETDVTNILTTELGKLENLSSDEVQTIVDNTVGQKETLNEDGTVDQESTGLFGEIGGLAADIDTLGTAVGDLDTTVDTLGTTVGDLGTTVDTLGTTVGDLSTTVGDLGTTVGTLGTTVGDLETTLSADINAVADLIGKPAREVTQTDVDFVIDLVAQQNVSDELVLEYDVTGDGTVDELDVDLLQQTLTGEDTTLADTSVFTPATGLFAQQEQDTQTTQDLITDLATDINTEVQTQTQQQNVADLAELLAGARDARGTRVDVKTPQELADITPYDFQTIFRDQQQAGKFVGPYGDPRAAFGIPANISRPPLGRVSRFSRGGQVEDNNDMLLRILGELE